MLIDYKTSLKWMLAGISVYCLAACDAKMSSSRYGSSSASGGITSNPSSPGASPSGTNRSGTAAGTHIGTSAGTGDTGGGNGINGKVLESYIVDPTTLPAYKAELEKMFETLRADDPSKYDKPDDSKLRDLFKLKTWYVAPVQLQKLSKDTLGLRFVDAKVDQLALQNSTEVWINQETFDHADVTAQANLILHEYVMNLYLVKFMSAKDFCKMGALMNPEKKESDSIDLCLSEKGMGAYQLLLNRYDFEKPRKLKEEDYQRIRYVTGWLFQRRKQSISPSEFRSILHGQSFPSLFWNQPEELGGNSEIELSVQSLVDIVTATQMSGNMPNQCYFVDAQSPSACQLEVTRRQTTNSQGELVENMALDLKQGNENLHIDLLDLNLGRATISLTADYYASHRREYSTVLTSQDYMTYFSEGIVLGKKDYSVKFTFLNESNDNDRPNLKLISVSVAPGVISGVVKSKDKDRVDSCITIQKPNPTKLDAKDVFVASNGIGLDVWRADLAVGYGDSYLQSCFGGEIKVKR